MSSPRRLSSSSSSSSSSSLSLVALAAAFTAGSVVGAVLVVAVSTKRRRRRNNTLDRARAHLWKLVEHSFSGALLYVGDKLHIYDTLAAANGSISAKQLAQDTGYSERWLMEFLGQASAAGLVECHYQDDNNTTFFLQEPYKALLQSPDKSPESLIGLFQFLHGLVGHDDRVERTCRAIQTGLGVDYDHTNHQHDVIHGIDRKNRNWFRDCFIDHVIRNIVIPTTKQEEEEQSSLYHRLQQGMTVADIGCGCGSSTLALATHFPNSHFYAYELSPESLRVMKERMQHLPNVTICNVAERGIDKGPDLPLTNFDFVYAHDVLHDMTNPKELIRQVRDRLSPENGVWVIVDVECHGSLQENLRKPSAATSLGFSCLLCLSSSTSEKGGQGLGTMGFHTNLARQWMMEAGFSHFETMKIKSLPLNSCFIVR